VRVIVVLPRGRVKMQISLATSSTALCTIIHRIVTNARLIVYHLVAFRCSPGRIFSTTTNVSELSFSHPRFLRHWHHTTCESDISQALPRSGGGKAVEGATAELRGRESYAANSAVRATAAQGRARQCSPRQTSKMPRKSTTIRLG
jgi:hypothetical protein